MKRLIVVTIFWIATALAVVLLSAATCLATMPWLVALTAALLICILVVPLMAVPVFRVWAQELRR